MPGLLRDPRVESEIEKYRADRERRKALTAVLLDFDDPVAREWTPVWRELDPLIRLARARPNATDPDMNVRGGFYHWVRDNPSAAPTVEPITEDGRFVEPTSAYLDRLRANDLQNPAVRREHQRERVASEKAIEKRTEDDRARRREGVADRYRSKVNASVSMAGRHRGGKNV